METISINFQIPSSWSELSDKQFRTIYQLIADDFSCQREHSSSSLETMPSAAENKCSYMSTDELKTLCLLNRSRTKVLGRQDSGSYLLKKGNILFEITPLTIAEFLPYLDWLGATPPMPTRLVKLKHRSLRGSVSQCSIGLCRSKTSSRESSPTSCSP